MPILLRPQRSYLPVDESGRELLEYPYPAFPCFMEKADLSKYPDVPWHWHEIVEFCLVRDGMLDFLAANHTCRLHAGEGCFVNRNVMHSAQMIKGAPALTAAVQFSPELFTGGRDSPLYQQLVLPVFSHPGLSFLHLTPDTPWQSELLGCLRAVLAVGPTSTRGKELLITSHLSRVWHLLLGNGLREAPASAASFQSEQRVKTMMQFIHLHYPDPLTLEQIAASASISPRECSRCFARVIGDSPISYLVKYRVSMAAALLETTGCTVTEAADQTGFNNPSYFTRAFTRQMGVSPKAYRTGHGGPSGV